MIYVSQTDWTNLVKATSEMDATMHAIRIIATIGIGLVTTGVLLMLTGIFLIIKNSRGRNR